jgi:DnaJ-class molecular chaperone
VLSKIELKTIASVIGSLDHYKVLKVDPLSTEDEIRNAFHQEALLFHPDQYFSESDSELGDYAKSIYARIVSAYRELSNPKSRNIYDKKMGFTLAGENLRESQMKAKETADEVELAEDPMIDDEATTSIRRRPSWAAKAPGEKFFQLAEQAYASRDLRSALMNLQIALSAEPENERYLRFKADLEKQLEKKKD